MGSDRKRIGVVAPGSRIEPSLAEQVKGIAATLYPDNTPQIDFHPQCFLTSGHFAGDDISRQDAFVEVANDPNIDAVWIAKGGYGACRLLDGLLPRLSEVAMSKTFLGYSDVGSIFAALYGAGFGGLTHGPMPTDLLRDRGEAAVKRSLRYLVEGAVDTLEGSVSSSIPSAAFNITILGHLMGTPYQPPLADHVLMLEDISEHMYRIDRTMFQITSNTEMRKVAGIRLGRCSDIPANDPDFQKSEEDVFQHWCRISGIPYLGRADIGHDFDNKIVPFGRLG